MVYDRYLESYHSDKMISGAEDILIEFLKRNRLLLLPPVDIFAFITSCGFDIRAAKMMHLYEIMIIVNEIDKKPLSNRFNSNKVLLYDIDSYADEDFEYVRFGVAYIFAKYIIEKCRNGWNDIICTDKTNCIDQYDALAGCIANKILNPVFS